MGDYDLPPGARCYPTQGAGVPGPKNCSTKLPRPSFYCCSGYGPTADVDLSEYDFALEFEALRHQITDIRALETFDLWSGMLNYHRSIALHQHAAYKLIAAVKEAEALPREKQK